MLRALCLAVIVLGPPWGRASADAAPDSGANAALQYWQAFATLPKFTEAEQTKLGECLTMPLDAQARETVSRSEYALRMLNRGAALARCDWGIPWESEGIETHLPHCVGARVLVNVACLRARLRFEEGKTAAAIDDIIAGMTLGRHISRDAVFVALLTGYAVEHRMIDALALNLPRLDARTIEGLQKRLAALPVSGRPPTAMLYEEKSFFDWFVRTVKKPKDREGLLALLSQLTGSPEEGRAFLEESGGDLAGMLRFAEQTRECYRRMGKKLDLPLDQVAKEMEREEKMQAANPVFKTLFPALIKVRLAQLRADLRRALLSAALAVQLHGESALKDHPDPVLGGAFEYAPFEGGFELRSKWKLDEERRSQWKLGKGSANLAEPVALTVGRRGK
jgi:hypothetical protein